MAYAPLTPSRLPQRRLAGMQRARGPHPHRMRRIIGISERGQPLLQGSRSGAGVLAALLSSWLRHLCLQRLCFCCQVPKCDAMLHWDGAGTFALERLSACGGPSKAGSAGKSIRALHGRAQRWWATHSHHPVQSLY